jgi:hypothetical protein
MSQSRRQFLADVAKGALVASLGNELSTGMNFGSAWAQETPERLHFGRWEPLVALLQETPAEKILPVLVERLKSGLELRELVGATALANSRTFGGEDYIGFHSLMALMPCWNMSKELPKDRSALPVLKVVYRNVARMQAQGGRANEVLHPVEPAGQGKGRAVRDAVRDNQVDQAEAMFSRVAQGPAEEAFNELLVAQQDQTEVHRVVLTYRSYDLLSLVGRENAHTMLRQAVRNYCAAEAGFRKNPHPMMEKSRSVRTVLPKLFEEHRLDGRMPGTRSVDDAWVEQFAKVVFESDCEEAAGAVAAAVAEGIELGAIHQALSLVGNQLVRTDRTPVAHGNTGGVHGSDTLNAYRQMSRAASPRNAIACAILAGFHIAWERSAPRDKRFTYGPFPMPEVTESDAAALQAELGKAIRTNDQTRAMAVAHRYVERGHELRPMFDALLKVAVSEDGKLHSEKYYNTCVEEVQAARPRHRGRYLVGLARYMASAWGQPAPGFQEACELLKVT